MRDWLSAQRTAPQFASEEEAVRLCFEALRPFCSRLVRDPEISGGLIPDIGFRLAALPDIPLLLEVKPFAVEGFGTMLAEGIAQASDYADRIKTKAFVGPLYGRKATDLHWQDHPGGAMCLLGAQFNVGGLLTAGEGLERIVVLLLAQAPVATLTFNEYGDPCCRLHSNAAHLLLYKDRAGSASWRNA
jgi:hypothetical protein